MSTPSLAPPAAATAAAANRAHGRGQRMLRRAAMAWLACAGLGQLLFALYVAGFYGRTTLAGQPQRWNEVMPHGYVAGDSTFNAVLGLHLLLAVAIIVAGLMQLSPALRQRLPRLHRWIGRGYVLAAALLAIGGLLMVWVRGGAAGDTAQHLGTSLNALLILWFAAMAWWRARQGRLGAHRPWALRLFLAVAGVWFFRIGLMLWLLLNQGPAGFDPVRFSGPALTTLAFAQTLLPLAVLELYLLAQCRRSALLPWLGSGVLALAALATLVGSLTAAAMMWWPALSG